MQHLIRQFQRFWKVILSLHILLLTVFNLSYLSIGLDAHNCYQSFDLATDIIAFLYEAESYRVRPSSLPGGPHYEVFSWLVLLRG